MIETQTEVIYRPEARAEFPMLREFWVERGDRDDWLQLQHLHYKMHSEPVGAKYWRLRFRGETAGVCVFGMSRPLLKERHAIFPNLRPGNDSQISNIHRYRYINDNFRVIGRFVVDTLFRSSGVAYRFANLASRQFGFQYAEIQSSMSKYNLFAQRAGFTMVKPIRSIHYDKGIKFMRRWFSAHPADLEALVEEFETFPEAFRAKVEHEAKEFYYGHSPLEKTGSRRHYSQGVVDNWPIRRTLSKIQGLCFASPLYGLYRNPDAGRELPASLPLLAFDRQPVTEPLRLEGVEPGADVIVGERDRALDEGQGANDGHDQTEHGENGATPEACPEAAPKAGLEAGLLAQDHCDHDQAHEPQPQQAEK